LTMQGKTPETIILGAGLTGLSAAYHGGGTVYEKSDGPGGKCISPKIDGYTFDLGIHVLHTRNEYVLNLLQNELKVDFIMQDRAAWIYSHETLTHYPFQANTFGLPIPIVKECLLSFIHAYQKSNGSKNHVYHNYEDWINAHFGKGIAKHFMVPYAEKFWTVSPKEMTTDWLDVRVPMPTLEEVVEGALTRQTKGFGPNIKFRYPSVNGIFELAESFVRGGVNVLLNKTAIQVDLERKKITFSDGTSCSYEVLISTIPLPELVRLSRVPEPIVAAAERLRYNSILCVNLGIDRDNLNANHWIYFPEKEYSFFRISFLKNFAASMTPGGKSSISAEIAYSGGQSVNKEQIVERVVEDLVKAKILLQKDRIDLVDVRDMKYGYVIYDHDREQSLKMIKNFFRRNSVLVAGRYGNWEYQWMDDAILDGKKVAEEASDFVARGVK